MLCAVKGWRGPRKLRARLELVFGTEGSALPGWVGEVGCLRFRTAESWAG